jgi:hypothetical protein
MLLVREQRHAGFNPMKDFSPFCILKEFNSTKENIIFQRNTKYNIHPKSTQLHCSCNKNK